MLFNSNFMIRGKRKGKERKEERRKRRKRGARRKSRKNRRKLNAIKISLVENMSSLYNGDRDRT